MPGKTHRFTEKQDRQAKHIADSEMARGKSPEDAKAIAYGHINATKKGKSRKKSKRVPRYS